MVVLVWLLLFGCLLFGCCCLVVVVLVFGVVVVFVVVCCCGRNVRYSVMVCMEVLATINGNVSTVAHTLASAH